MNIIAERVKQIPPYLFADFAKKKAALIAAGKDVIDLGIGAPDGATPQFIIDKMYEEMQKSENHRYSSFQGCAEFREAVAHFYEKVYGVTLNPETEILTLIGSKEGIVNLLQTLINPGEGVLVPNPGYPAYKTAVHLAGGLHLDLPLDAQRGFKPNWDGLTGSERAKVMLLNYPNNPTGATVTLDDFRDAIRFAKKHQLFTIHDSAYNLIQFADYQAPSLLQVEGAKEMAVEVGSLSKNFNMSGWRIGYIVGNSDVIQALSTLKSNIDTSQFLAIQKAAAAALKSDLSFPKASSALFEKRMRLMHDALNRLGLETEPTRGTIFIWAKVPKPFTSAEFATLLLEKAYTIVTPGHLFGSGGEGYIRISLTVNEERLQTVISRLEKILL